MLSRRALRRFAIVWVLLVIVLSLQPVRPAGIHKIPLRHRIVHVLTFILTTTIVLSLSRAAREEWKGAAGLVCLGAGIETAQFLIYRLPEIEWWDIREDSIGILLGLALIRFTPIRTLLLSPAQT